MEEEELECCGGGMMPETHTKLWVTTCQVAARAGRMDWRLIMYGGCRTAFEGKKSNVMQLVWLASSKADQRGDHPGEKSIFVSIKHKM